ncbi:MAG: DNA-protecting protein DprA [Taibaiella sp.]|nr:DNA-protecting protein DprA [Taibaiella sp.]
MLPEDQEEIFSQLALTFVNGIGIKITRLLIEQYGSAKAIFKAPLKKLIHIDGITEVKAKGFKDPEIFNQAEAELAFILKHDIQVLFVTHPLYPQRLHQCSDAPMLLYYKGTADLNAKKIVAIVGTRKNSDYGEKITEELVDGLRGQEDIIITSGLAHGIDAIAHRRSVTDGIRTVGVVGHGLDRIYPVTNKKLSNDMIHAGGGILTEFRNGTLPDRSNFPMRNRVVAGISDVTIVVESPISGGALITAHMAGRYNREVAAFPGRTIDDRSAGCNELIRTNIASMITCADDLLTLMNWDQDAKPKAVQKQLFLNLSADEQKIVDLLQAKDAVHADELYHGSGMNNSQLAATLLQLEMQGLIKTLPGKNYRMN